MENKVDEYRQKDIVPSQEITVVIERDRKKKKRKDAVWGVTRRCQCCSFRASMINTKTRKRSSKPPHGRKKKIAASMNKHKTINTTCGSNVS